MHRGLSPSAFRHHSRPGSMAECLPAIQPNFNHRAEFSRNFRQNREQTTHFHHQTHHVPVKEAATWYQKVLLQGNNRHRLPVPDWFIRKALPRHTKRRDFSVRSQWTGRCYRHSNPDLPYSDACHIRLESFYAIYIRYNIA